MWSQDKITEELFLCLAKHPERKYDKQAKHLQFRIPICDPPPAFVVDVSDVNPAVLKQLAQCTEDQKRDILLDAVGRLFENNDPDRYHRSIKRRLVVTCTANAAARTSSSKANDLPSQSASGYAPELRVFEADEPEVDQDIEQIRSELSGKTFSRYILPSENRLRVSQAIRRNDGTVTVTGMIVGISYPYKMIDRVDTQCRICAATNPMNLDPPVYEFRQSEFRQRKICCHNSSDLFDQPRYVTAKSLELQDVSPAAGMEDRLEVIVFEDDIDGIVIGEQVTVTGNIHVQKDSKKKKSFPVLFATSVQKDRRVDIEITNDDVRAFKRFSEKPELIRRLVSMVAPSVIGHDDKKIAILRSAVGSPKMGKRGQIHTLLVGTPGTAKSMLAEEATSLIPGSIYISGQGASGKSLTAIIEKNDVTMVTRLGPVPLSKNAICAINEIGRMRPEDQEQLLDPMEEGKFTITKYGNHQSIDSPTTMVATANPVNSGWSDNAPSLDQVPVVREVLERFDQIIFFRDDLSEEELRLYADKRAELARSGRPHNYNFLKKYIKYARTLQPKLSSEAESMLKEFWLTLRASRKCSNRALDSLFRMAFAQARLHLSKTVDTAIAKEVIDWYKGVMAEMNVQIGLTPVDPRLHTYEAIIKVVLGSNGPVKFADALKMVADNDPWIRHYLGGTLAANLNKKVRGIQEMLSLGKDGRIRIVNLRPLMLEKTERSEGSQALEEDRSGVSVSRTRILDKISG